MNSMNALQSKLPASSNSTNSSGCGRGGGVTERALTIEIPKSQKNPHPTKQGTKK